MAEAFLHLSPKDQREVLEVASAASGRPVHLLEKDVWVAAVNPTRHPAWFPFAPLSQWAAQSWAERSC